MVLTLHSHTNTHTCTGGLSSAGPAAPPLLDLPPPPGNVSGSIDEDPYDPENPGYFTQPAGGSRGNNNTALPTRRGREKRSAGSTQRGRDLATKAPPNNMIVLKNVPPELNTVAKLIE